MSARSTFIFGAYRLRPATEEDAAYAVPWTEADPDHAGKTAPAFWLEQQAQRDSYMLEDEEGPLFFFKLHHLARKVVELHVQFPPPSGDSHQRYRIQRGLIDGFQWLEETLKQAHIEVVHFDSTHPPLRRFAMARLGFDTNLDNRLSKSIGV
jgi:hypothetical protein